jgi:hypothetical protein
MKKNILILASLIASLFIISSCTSSYQFQYSVGCSSSHITGTPSAASADLKYLDSAFLKYFGSSYSTFGSDSKASDEEAISKFNSAVSSVVKEGHSFTGGTYTYGLTRLSTIDASSTVIASHTFGE